MTCPVRSVHWITQHKVCTADDLGSFASFIRTVRTYGIHPNIVDDEAAEDVLTEAGCFSIIQRGHAHLIALLAAVDSVTSARSAGPSDTRLP